MRLIIKKAAILGGLSVSLLSTSAFAGGCFPGPVGPVCSPDVIAHPGGASQIDPMHVYSQRPMGHLRSVQYLGTPSVNITRVHGAQGAPSVADTPSSFTGGCTPESTHYCRAGNTMPAPVMAPPAPVYTPAPVIAPPAPVMAQPAPQITERVVAIGGGYDPSKFIPRTYGSNELTPGIAHIPTSIVDRSHENATAVLNGGMTQPQAIASGGTVPHPSMVSSSAMSSGSSYSSSSFSSQNYSGMGGNVIGSVTNSVTMAPTTNVYPGSMSSSGTYYEKVSGPTMVGGMQATQVICARQAPRVDVQSPVIGVPSPVPTPVMTQCQSGPAMAPVMGHGGPVGHGPVSSGRYGSTGTAMPSSGLSGRYGSARYGH